MNTLRDDQSTFFIMSRSVLLRMRNVSEKKICRESQTQFVFNNFYFESCAVYEIMWKNLVQPGRPQMRICIACWIPKATNTKFGICNTALLLQQWLHERAPIFVHTYIASLVILFKVTYLNNTRRTGCCISTAIMVTQKRHDMTFSIHRLSCSVQALLYRNARCRGQCQNKFFRRHECRHMAWIIPQLFPYVSWLSSLPLIVTSPLSFDSCVKN